MSPLSKSDYPRLVLPVVWTQATGAWACPACAGQESGGSVRWMLLGLMVGAPFALAALVFLLVRRHADAAAAVDREGA